MAGFTFRAAAADDVAEAYEWYEQEEPGLGERFLHAVGDAAERAAAGPEHYPLVRGDVRRVLVGPFPYGLCYRVLRRRVVVVACYHLHRDGDRVYNVGQLSVDSGRLVRVEIRRPGNGAHYPGLLAAINSARYHGPALGRPAGWVLGPGTLHLLPNDTADLAFQFDALVDRRMTERPRDLIVSAKAPEDMGYRELGRYIRAVRRSGADVNTLRVTRMLKIAVPATCVIILLFGAPLATSTQRGGAAYGVGLSLATTILFLVLIQLTKAIGGKGLITPELAAWLPSLLFGGAGAALLHRTRT